jgi:hypothetical protein
MGYRSRCGNGRPRRFSHHDCTCWSQKKGEAASVGCLFDVAHLAQSRRSIYVERRPCGQGGNSQKFKGKRPSNSTSKLKLRNVRINRIQPFENQFIISFGFTSLNSRSSIRRLPAYAPSIMPVTVSQCPLPATASQPFLAAQRATAATTSAAAIGMALSFVFADEPDSNLSFSSVAECG